MSSGYNEAPSRPSLPPLAVAALLAWLAILLVEELSWRAFIGELPVPAQGILALALVILLGTAAFARARRKRGVLLVIAAFSTAALCAGLHWSAWQDDARMLPELLDARGVLELDITSDPAQRDYGTVSNAEHRIGAHVVKLRVLWQEGADPVSPGHCILAHGAFSSIKHDDSGHWNRRNGFVGTMRVDSFEETGVSSTLQGLATAFRDASFERVARLEGDAAGLLAGVLLGNKTLFNGSELELSFQTTGLAHLMAVSGTHLAIVTVLIALVVSRTHLRRSQRNSLMLVALLSYVAITGFAPSAMRACTMCGIALLLGALKRRAFVLNALALCVFLFLGLSPTIAFSMGFQLSVLSVLGLVVFTRLAHHWFAHAVPKAPEWLVASIAATLAASCITLPVTVTQFAQLPLVSPLANLIAAPLVTAALCVGVVAILTCALFEPLGMFLLHVAGVLANLCAKLVSMLADLPFACMPISNGSPLLGIMFAIMLVVLWIIWPTPDDRAKQERCSGHHSATERDAPSCLRHLGTACLVSSVCVIPLLIVMFFGFGQQAMPGFASDARVVMLDVGQGDSFLVQSGEASALIDTGEDSDVLIRELAEQGIASLDAVFITHKDADHVGALRKLAGIVEIDHVYIHEDLLDMDLEAQVLESARWVTNGSGAEGVCVGSRFKVGSITLEMLGPERGGSSENDDSLIMLLEHDANEDGIIESRGLFTGDAEKDAIQPLVASIGDIDFLKVAHHGSAGGLSKEQLAILKPEIALVSVGANNRFGHPTKETLGLLDEAGARVYRSDERGAVTMRFAERGYSILTEKG